MTRTTKTFKRLAAFALLSESMSTANVVKVAETWLRPDKNQALLGTVRMKVDLQREEPMERIVSGGGGVALCLSPERKKLRKRSMQNQKIRMAERAVRRILSAKDERPALLLEVEGSTKVSEDERILGGFESQAVPALDTDSESEESVKIITKKRRKRCKKASLAEARLHSYPRVGVLKVFPGQMAFYASQQINEKLREDKEWVGESCKVPRCNGNVTVAHWFKDPLKLYCNGCASTVDQPVPKRYTTYFNELRRHRRFSLLAPWD